MINIAANLDTADIQRQLNALSAELKIKAVRAGIAKVATLDIKLMKGNAPEETGDLKAAVGRRQLSKSAMSRLGMNSAGTTLAVVVGPNRKIKGQYKGRLANITEGGAKPHVILPRNESRVHQFLKAQGLRGDKSMILADGKGLFARKINHPGMRPMPFMKKTHDQSASQVERLFYTGVRDYLARVQR
jgi:hypothetical protein